MMMILNCQSSTTVFPKLLCSRSPFNSDKQPRNLTSVLTKI